MVVFGDRRGIGGLMVVYTDRRGFPFNGCVRRQKECPFNGSVR